MLYLLAAIGAICVAVLLWRAFVAGPGESGEQRPARTRRTTPVAPDDDPEFLRKLGQRKPPPDSDDTPPS